jgi:hypothetical protein
MDKKVMAFWEAVRAIVKKQAALHSCGSNQKGRPKRPDRLAFQAALGLLDFGFLELDMLAHDGVIFAERHLFGDVARIFLGHVEEARVSGAEQLDLDRGWLRHGPFLLFKNFAKNCTPKRGRCLQTGANADSRG